MSATTRMTTRSRAGLIAVTTIALLGVSPAGATTVRFTDPSGDLRTGADIHAVTVTNGVPVKVRVAHRSLERNSRNGFEVVYFDTRRRDPGPEFAASGGLGRPRDWMFFKTERWSGPYRAVECPVRMWVHFAADTSGFVVPRRCLGNPRAAIRVAVQVTTTGGAEDWAPARHRFSPRVD
jgi:hypothetical protein